MRAKVAHGGPDGNEGALQQRGAQHGQEDEPVAHHRALHELLHVEDLRSSACDSGRSSCVSVLVCVPGERGSSSRAVRWWQYRTRAPPVCASRVGRATQRRSVRPTHSWPRSSCPSAPAEGSSTQAQSVVSTPSRHAAAAGDHACTLTIPPVSVMSRKVGLDARTLRSPRLRETRGVGGHGEQAMAARARTW